MILGIGTDLIELDRIRVSLEKYAARFKNRVFTPTEIAYCDAHGSNAYRHYAARFAAKEALMKALGLGWQPGTSWKEIEVVRDENGRPHLRLNGTTARTAKKLKAKNILLSLTHSQTHAAAMVLIEK